MSKTNIEHLRDILSKFDLEDTTEALEFLDSIEKELTAANHEITQLKENVRDLADEDPPEPDYDNSDFLGLDTLHWKLENGNLKIQQQTEKFIETLKKQNCVSIA